jgi:uncharacterized protein
LIGTHDLTYIRAIEPRWVEVTQKSVVLPQLDPAFEGYRIVHISDPHLGPWMDGPRLRALAEIANQQAANLIVITGDFLSGKASHLEQDIRHGLEILNAPDGVLAVLGNHDHWNQHGSLTQMLTQLGIGVLNNSVNTLRRNGSALHLAGVDSHMAQRADLPKVLQQLPANGCAILLAHEPDFADISAASGRFDLQLSGHSHGGQIYLPLLGSLFYPRYAHKYPRGMYKVGSMLQYTNRGLGMVHMKLRFNCRPEVTVFTLHSALAAPTT